MPAINFTEAQSVPGNNGTLYLFNTAGFNIYKITDVVIHRTVTTETWYAKLGGSFQELFEMLSQTEAIDVADVFKYYHTNSVLYVFVATSVDSLENKLVIRRKRNFKLTTDSSQKFDVFDKFFPVLLDYAQQFYSNTKGVRLDKFAQRRIEDFEAEFPAQ